MKFVKGDVFKLKTKIGYGFLQYIKTDRLGIDFVRVLDPINSVGDINQPEVDALERWCAGFPLKAALKMKIVEKVGGFEVPSSFVDSDYARSKHVVRGEFLGWFIVHKPSLKRELKKKLNKKDIKLSPYGVMNETLIIERLEESWRLDEWK